tara:strand:+ start:323 stop:727 length:405 start_codon:yes stop_codon:yes gene_type:complete
MPTETTAPTVDKLTRIYIKIRDARTQLASTFKDEDAVLSAQLDTVKAELLKYCADNGVESMRTADGIFYRTTKTRYWTSDWESMHKFILEHEVPEFLDKRLNQGTVKQFLEENPEAVPPGLNADVEYVITVRKK